MYVIKYKGILTEMYVTGFSEPMIVDDGSEQRSVKATSRKSVAHVFSENSIDDALELTRRCFPDAQQIQVGDDSVQ
jgi:hypothetical protein